MHQGNLTGSLRKVKDSVADIHNLVLKWNNHNIEGLTVIEEIANIKLESVYVIFFLNLFVGYTVSFLIHVYILKMIQ